MAHTNPVEEHFRLYTLAAAATVLEQAAAALGSREELLDEHEFLRLYADACREAGVDNDAESSIASWESAVESHLPVRALRSEFGLTHSALTLLFAAGLLEEDARFGALFSTFQQGSAARPTLGLLTAWWREEDGCREVRRDVSHLLRAGLLQAANPDAPRLDWILHPPAVLWDCVRGEAQEQLAPWVRYVRCEHLPELSDVVLPYDIARTAATVASLLQEGGLRHLIVRGPNHNGRSLTQRAIAKEIGRGVLEFDVPDAASSERLRVTGALAAALYAMPVVRCDRAASNMVAVPGFGEYRGPAGFIASRSTALDSSLIDDSLTITLDIPPLAQRVQHWQRALPSVTGEAAGKLAASFRTTSGNIYRAALGARAQAQSEGRSEVDVEDVTASTRMLHRQALGDLAVWLPPCGSWERMAASPDLLGDLQRLQVRCTHRETLHHAVGPALRDQLNAGVRALFTGQSGTGKTLAARLLAGALRKDLYRVDLSSVVSKYIGETEKNLNQVLQAAEEHDVLLLLDEGDSLMTNRTAVNSSVDRYANLETNFLLQRLEAYEGILIVTTNSPQSIDSAFQRRMDAVIDFRLPDAPERFNILQLHLPVSHAVEYGRLEEIAVRCTLSGGQLRNAVLHAALLGLEDAQPLGYEHLERALQREYRRLGAVCPLRRHPTPQPVT